MADSPIGTAFVAIRPDTKGFQGQTEKEVEGALTGVAKKAAVAIGGVFAAAKVKDLIFGSVQDASNLNETISKTQVVFGDAAKEALKFGDNSAQAIGQSKNTALGALATFGNLFVAMGLGTGEALKLSKGIVTLASDLASFNNASPEDVLLALRSGLVGETEPLRQFGINLSAARIEARALELGLGKTKDELTAGAKAQAAYSLILDDTKTAQGDFGRTAQGAANQQRILNAEMENLSAEIGGKLLPVFTEALGIGLKVIKFLDGLSVSFEDVVFIAPAVAGAIALIGIAMDSALGPVGIFALAVSSVVLIAQKLGLTAAPQVEHFTDNIAKLIHQIDAFEPEAAVRSFLKFVQAGDSVQLKLDGAGKALGAFIRVAEASPASAQKLIDTYKALGSDTDEFERALAHVIQTKKKDIEGTEAQVAANKALLATLDDVNDAVLRLAGGEIGYEAALRSQEKATRDVDVAIRDHGENSDEAKDALLRLRGANLDVAKSALELDEAQKIVNADFDAAPEKIQEEINKLEEAKQRHPAVAASYDPILEKLYALRDAQARLEAEKQLLIRLSIIGSEEVQSVLRGFGIEAPLSLPGLASGGDVSAGTYLVGERGNGAELLTLNPGSSGTVTNAQQTSELLDGSGSGTTIYNEYNIVAPTQDTTRFAVELAQRQRAAMYAVGS